MVIFQDIAETLLRERQCRSLLRRPLLAAVGGVGGNVTSCKHNVEQENCRVSTESATETSSWADCKHDSFRCRFRTTILLGFVWSKELDRRVRKSDFANGLEFSGKTKVNQLKSNRESVISVAA